MFAFNGMRQMLALAFVVQSYESLKKKRVVQTVIWVALASTIHTSALVFVALLILHLVMKSEAALKPSLIACLLLPSLMPLFQILTNLVSDQYASYFINNYWNASVGGIVLIWMLAFASLIVVCRKDKSHSGRLISSAVGVYLSLSVASLSVSILERVALYAQVFLLLLFPRCLETVNEKNQWWYIAVVVLLLLLLYVSYATSPARVYVTFL